jgi:hypothetical protein
VNNGDGTYTNLYYTDKKGNPVDKERASKVNIQVFDDTGKCIHRTYGDIGSRQSNFSEIGPEPLRLIPLPDIRQEDDYSCGAMCAMAVGRYFGVGPDSKEDWKSALDTTKAKSTNPHKIASYLSQLGLKVETRYDMDINDLKECWINGTPVICPVQEYMTPSKQTSDKYGHYVVVVGNSLGMVFVQDPSIDNVLKGEDARQDPGIMPIREDDWMKMWWDEMFDEEFVRFGIVVNNSFKV